MAGRVKDLGCLEASKTTHILQLILTLANTLDRPYSLDPVGRPMFQ